MAKTRVPVAPPRGPVAPKGPIAPQVAPSANYNYQATDLTNITLQIGIDQTYGTTTATGAAWIQNFDISTNLYAPLILQPDQGAGSFVGVNNTDPNYTLDVVGDVNVTGGFLINGVPISGDVVSVFGRIGAIVATDGDYTASQVTVAPAVAGATDVQTALGLMLPLAGGIMTGTLTLAANPTVAMQAATKAYVDTLVTGTMSFIGGIDATTGLCTYTAASGYTDGPVIPAGASNTGQYIICQNPGTIPSGPAMGITMRLGDWLVSDGANWSTLQVGGPITTASLVGLTPTVFGATDVQTALENAETQFGDYLPLTGGTLTGALAVQAEVTAVSYNTTSMRKLKKNIRRVKEAEIDEAFAGLKPVRYRLRSQADHEEFGFIVEEMAECGELKGTLGYNSAKPVSYSLAQILALAVAKIQQLEARLAEREKVPAAAV